MAVEPISLRAVNPEDPQPVYRQIAASIRNAIEDGTYPAGGRLPSLRDLCAHFHVASGTVNDALRVLATERLAYSRQGAGWYVLTNSVARAGTAQTALALDGELRQALLLLAHLTDTPLKGIPDVTEQIAAILRGVQHALGFLHERDR